MVINNTRAEQTMIHAVSPVSTAGAPVSWAAAASIVGNTAVASMDEVNKTLSLPIAVSSPEVLELGNGAPVHGPWDTRILFVNMS
jgi:hypothetical protein